MCLDGNEPVESALFADLYALTMSQAYWSEGLTETAVFELFFRELPKTRHFVLAAGLNELLKRLSRWRFQTADLAYLRDLGQFDERFLDELARWRWQGEVWAVPEGTVVFPNEPLVQVVAPILDGQLLETIVLNQVHYQSVLASKAVRVVAAASGRRVIDFGSRRAHGSEAALGAARASYLAGADGTSNLLAGMRYGIPVFGTMAHSYIQAHDDEMSAFEAFARIYANCTLLVDTYDTLRGVQHVIDLRRRLGNSFRCAAVRLDSGDLGELASETRRMLDAAGLGDVEIFASSGLDEYQVARLVRDNTPIDGFGVGTSLAVSDDAPALDMAYKLVAYAGQPRTKFSSNKVIYPGRKQVFRVVHNGQFSRDILARSDELHEGEPLLRCVMKDGELLSNGSESLLAARRRAAGEMARLPDRLRSLSVVDAPYRPMISDVLQIDLENLRQSFNPTSGPGT